MWIGLEDEVNQSLSANKVIGLENDGHGWADYQPV